MSEVAVIAEAVSAAPPERVFEILTDWPRHAEWMPFTSAEGGTKAGDEISARTGVGPVGFTGDIVGQPTEMWIPLMMQPSVMRSCGSGSAAWPFCRRREVERGA